MYKVFYYKNGELVQEDFKYIDKITYDILEIENNSIKVQEPLVDIIVLLNKKGYNTKRSYSGYAKIYKCREIYEDENLEEASDEEYKEYITKESEIDNNIESPLRLGRDFPDYTFIRIDFDKGYRFNDLPEGFNAQYSNGKSIMDNMVFEFYKKGHCDIDNETMQNYKENKITKIIKEVDLRNKSPREVQEELNYNYKILLKWIKMI